MKRTLIISVILCLVAATGAAFADSRTAAPKPPRSTPTLKSERAAGQDLSGKVVETMDAGGYTYICLEKAGKKVWVAVPQMKVTKGATMAFQPGQTMTNFESKSLNRTFDRIVFSGGPAERTSGETLPQGHPSMPAEATGSKAQVGAKDATIKVEKASGPNAHTVADIYANRASLNKRTVSVKGKVVKVSTGIMGRNWVHLQDGTGDQQKATHDLVATTADLPAVGDVVTATGTFAKDRDFGAGYLYKAIIEDAKIAK